MKLRVFLGVVFIIALVVIFYTLVGFAFGRSGRMERKIVVFKSGILNEPAREVLVKQFGGVKIKDLTLIDGMAVLLPPQAEEALVHQAGVLRIDDDIIVEALIKGGVAGKPAPPQPVESLPWGVNRIDADLAWGTSTGDPIKVAIIDTGIDLAHPDLKANIKGGYNAINPTKSPNDDNGHGTHVAGIVAAIDNEIGVIGVGPQIDLYAVKVLSRTGSGYLSDVIEGLDWAISNGMQVVNMSLGTNTDVQSFRDAVIRVSQAGIIQVAAAGNNSGGSVTYPAAYPEVIAVSATDSSDLIASFSSVGPEIDLAAPGVNIYSTYKGSTYKTLSGTSMASPHVAGTVADILATPARAPYDSNLNGVWEPSEVKAVLQATADDLGVVGFDNYYGYGLVDTEESVTGIQTNL